MAITRSQIARQLLAEGGVSLDDAKMMAPEGEFLAYINPKEAQMLKDAGGSGIMTPMGIPSFVDFGGSGTGYGSAADTFSAAGGNPGENSRSDFGGDGGGDGGGNQPTPGPRGPTITGGDTDYQQYITQNPYGRQVTDFQRNVARGAAGIVGGPIASMTVNELLSREQEKQRDLQKAISGGQQFFGTTPRSLTTQFRETTGLKTGPSGPPGGDGGDSPIIPRLPQVASLPTDIETPKSDLQKSFDVRFFLDPRFEAKDGGEVTVDQAEKMAPPGESLAYINDDEAALLRAIGGAGEPVNQTGIPSYFIKKVFRKAKKAVKKIVKSPLGKAAIGIGLGAFAGGLGPFSAAGKFGSLKGAGFARGLFPSVMDYSTPTRSFFTSLGKGVGKAKEALGGNVGLGIAAASLAGGLMTPKQEEDELATTISKETGIPIAQIRKEVQEATAQGQDALDALKGKYPFLVRADSALKDGGKAKKKTYRYKDKPYGPKFAAEGGIMNLDGMEMDLRGGGFVPIGKAEKADDVPARLSKNEFVFTADAVRAAGGGSVDKGADLMYKTMKQLEDRVA
jgi:hypothetical protein